MVLCDEVEGPDPTVHNALNTTVFDWHRHLLDHHRIMYTDLIHDVLVQLDEHCGQEKILKED